MVTCFRKADFFSNEGTNTQLPENALREMNGECFTADIDVEFFILFDNELKIHQNYDSASFLDAEKFQNVEIDDNDANETSDEPKIKDLKSQSYIQKNHKSFQPQFQIQSYSILELTTKARTCCS